MQTQLLVFVLENQRYALGAMSVERVVHAAEVVPLPAAPDVVAGVIDIKGRVLPVLDIRKRFGLPGREIEPGDQMIIAHTSRRTVVLTVDGTAGVVELSDEAIVPAENILPSLEFVRGVVKLDDGLILIHNLDEFLSLEEERKLDDAIKPIGIAVGANTQDHVT